MTSWRPQRLTGEQGGTCCWSQATSPTASRRGRKTAPKIEPLVPLPEQRQWLATTATGPQVTTLHARAADPQTRGVRLAQRSQPASACRRQGSDPELGRAWGCPSIFRARPINVSERCGLAHKKAHAVLKPQSDLQTTKRNCGARAGGGGSCRSDSRLLTVPHANTGSHSGQWPDRSQQEEAGGNPGPCHRVPECPSPSRAACARALSRRLLGPYPQSRATGTNNTHGSFLLRTRVHSWCF